MRRKVMSDWVFEVQNGRRILMAVIRCLKYPDQCRLFVPFDDTRVSGVASAKGGVVGALRVETTLLAYVKRECGLRADGELLRNSQRQRCV